MQVYQAVPGGHPLSWTRGRACPWSVLAVSPGQSCASGELHSSCWLVRTRAWMAALEVHWKYVSACSVEGRAVPSVDTLGTALVVLSMDMDLLE